jgi:hypothetical protein
MRQRIGQFNLPVVMLQATSAGLRTALREDAGNGTKTRTS